MYSLGGPRKQITLSKLANTPGPLICLEIRKNNIVFDKIVHKTRTVDEKKSRKKVMFNFLRHNHYNHYVAEMQTKGDGTQ